MPRTPVLCEESPRASPLNHRSYLKLCLGLISPSYELSIVQESTYWIVIRFSTHRVIPILSSPGRFGHVAFCEMCSEQSSPQSFALLVPCRLLVTVSCMSLYISLFLVDIVESVL